MGGAIEPTAPLASPLGGAEDTAAEAEAEGVEDDEEVEAEDEDAEAGAGAEPERMASAPAEAEVEEEDGITSALAAAPGIENVAPSSDTTLVTCCCMAV